MLLRPTKVQTVGAAILCFQTAAVLPERCAINTDDGSGDDVHARLRYFLALHSRLRADLKLVLVSLLCRRKHSDKSSRPAMSYRLSSVTCRRGPASIGCACRHCRGMITEEVEVCEEALMATW